MFLGKRKGQSTLEYVILIGFITAALIAMGVYMKRGFQGRIRSSTDDIGEQYSPGHTASEYNTTTNLTQTETIGAGVTTTKIDTNLQTRTGSETVANQTEENW
jgi:Flp pilus assembly pilin Flp